MLKKTLLLSIPILLSACKESQEKDTALARVGETTLTLEDLRENFPPEYEQFISREQYLDFIKRWIDDEVLYQQALKRKLDQEPEVRRKIGKLTRKVLIEELLAGENSTEEFEPDEVTLSQFYEMNKEDFRRVNTEVKFYHIRLATLKAARDLRQRIYGDNFLSLATTHSLDPVPQSFDALTFKQAKEVNPCLAQDIFQAKAGSLTQTISCPEGFYLVKVLAREESGSLVSFEEAKEEIRGNLIRERTARVLENRVKKLKEGVSISFDLEKVPGQPMDSLEKDPLKASRPIALDKGNGKGDAMVLSNTPKVSAAPVKAPSRVRKTPKLPAISPTKSDPPATAVEFVPAVIDSSSLNTIVPDESHDAEH